jgi:hypothetical protein
MYRDSAFAVANGRACDRAESCRRNMFTDVTIDVAAIDVAAINVCRPS